MGKSVGEKESMVLVAAHIGRHINKLLLRDAQKKEVSKAWVLRDILRKYYKNHKN